MIDRLTRLRCGWLACRHDVHRAAVHQRVEHVFGCVRCPPLSSLQASRADFVIWHCWCVAQAAASRLSRGGSGRRRTPARTMTSLTPRCAPPALLFLFSCSVANSCDLFLSLSRQAIPVRYMKTSQMECDFMVEIPDNSQSSSGDSAGITCFPNPLTGTQSFVRWSRRWRQPWWWRRRQAGGGSGGRFRPGQAIAR